MSGVTNPDIQFFQAMVKAGIHPYVAEQAVRGKVPRIGPNVPWKNPHLQRFCGLMWSMLPHGKGEDCTTCFNKMVAAYAREGVIL